MCREERLCGHQRGVVTRAVWSPEGCGHQSGVVTRGVWSHERLCSHIMCLCDHQRSVVMQERCMWSHQRWL